METRPKIPPAARARQFPIESARLDGNLSLSISSNAEKQLVPVVERLLDAVVRVWPNRARSRQDGFEGNLTTSKYAKLAQCSQDTALRDILALVEGEVLVRNPAGGRSTSYVLTEPWPVLPENSMFLPPAPERRLAFYNSTPETTV